MLIEATLFLSLTEPLSVVSVSDSIENLLGFQAADYLSGKVLFQEQIHAQDHDIAKQLFSHDESEPYDSFNIRLRHADGRIRCIKGSYTKQQDSTGCIRLELLLQDVKGLWKASSESSSMMKNFKAMMDNTDDYIYFKDRNHVFTGASQTLVSITSPSQHWTDLLGLTDYDVFPEAYADTYYQLEKLVFSGVQVAHEVQEILNVDGNKGWVDNRKYPMHDDNGEIIGLFGIARDITANHQQQLKIEQLLAEKSTILNNSLVGIVTTRDRHVLWANTTIESMLGYDNEGMVGLSTRRFYARDEDYQMIGKAYENIETDGVICNELEFVRKDGQYLWVDMRGTILHQEKGESIWIFVDVTERKSAEILLLESEERLRLSQRYGGVGTWEYDFITEESVCSENVFQELGFPLKSDKPSWEDVFAAILAEDHQHVNDTIDMHIETGSALDVEYRILDIQNEIRWMRTVGKVEFNDSGIPVKMRGTVQDITALKKAEEEIENLAFYDYLTQLPNRRLLMDRLSQAIITSNRDGRCGALLFLDLDHFKELNDTRGHHVGDVLLQHVAERLSDNVRAGDTVARLGGDEFIVMLENLNKEAGEAAIQAENIGTKLLHAINQPYLLLGKEYLSSISIGITLFCANEDVEINELLKQADIAMYKAKNDSRNTLRFFKAEN